MAAVALLGEGASVPFVARYRAHVTGGLEPAQLRAIEASHREAADVQRRRDAIERALRERTPPVLDEGLLAALRAAPTLRALEALYEPFRARRDTLATRAHEAGVGELARALWSGTLGSDGALESGLRGAACGSVIDAEAHLVHALAELVALDEAARAAADGAYAAHGVLRAKAAPAAEAAEAAAFAHYAAYECALRRVRPHVWLALHRGSERGALKLSVALAPHPSGADGGAAAASAVERALAPLRALPPGSRRAGVLRRAAADAWSRLLSRAAAARARRGALERARAAALDVFSLNLGQLLRTPPVELPGAGGGTVARAVLGVDPGLAHGHKCAVVDARTGALLAAATVRAVGGGGGGSGGRGAAADEEAPPPAESVATLRALIRTHAVGLVAIGDGAGCALAQRAVAAALEGTSVVFAIVVEAGASAYSACALADAELPTVSVGERGAVSLARRLLDPLAELVKVPPSALGVGLYQKDATEAALLAAVRACVEDAVADVGVDVNRASATLLAAVPGLTAKTAAAIRLRVETVGPLRARAELRAVKGVGPKAYEHAAPFLRLAPADGRPPDEPLDATRVHPEAYADARRELAAVGADVRALAAGAPLAAAHAAALRARADALADPAERARARALAALLADPLLAGDPRRRLAQPPELRARARGLGSLAVGERLGATVRNVTPFGAFCDVGVGVDGLLHVSELGARGEAALQVGARLDARVLAVDAGRKRISLGLDGGPGGGGSGAGSAGGGGVGLPAAPFARTAALPAGSAQPSLGARAAGTSGGRGLGRSGAARGGSARGRGGRGAPAPQPTRAVDPAPVHKRPKVATKAGAARKGGGQPRVGQSAARAPPPEGGSAYRPAPAVADGSKKRPFDLV
jgi:uncharacterized protein